MNTNAPPGDSGNLNYGHYCHDYDGTKDPKINNDYLELMQGYTLTSSPSTSGLRYRPTDKFCGVFDGSQYIFPGITSKAFSNPIISFLHPPYNMVLNALPRQNQRKMQRVIST